MKKVIIEVGSTNTKCFIVKKGTLIEDNFQTIEFKKSYLDSKALDYKLVDKLIKVVNTYNKDQVIIFGTNIFRIIDKKSREDFLTYFKDKTGIDFRIISSKEENNKVVEAVIKDNNCSSKIGIVVTGSSSFEISIVENKKTIKSFQLKFGSFDIIKKYPEILEETVQKPYKYYINEVIKTLPNINEKVDTLILCGGNHLHFYNTLNYPLVKNTKCYGIMQEKCLDVISLYKQDQKYYKTPLSIHSHFTFYNSFIGNRGIRPIISALVKVMEVKYIVPTYILTAHGYIDSFK